MTTKNNPQPKVQASQKQAMQMNKGWANPGGEAANLPAKEIPAYTQDRNKGKSGIVIN